jgi:hypothetical protein
MWILCRGTLTLEATIAMKSPEEVVKDGTERHKKDKKEKELRGRENNSSQINVNKKPRLEEACGRFDEPGHLPECFHSSLTPTPVRITDHTEDQRVRAIQLPTRKVEDEEQNRKREERQRKRGEATKKSMPQVDVQGKST